MARREKNCAPEDRSRGDGWDHVALDPERRLVLSLVVGKRTEGATHALVCGFHRRTGGRVMRLITSDQYPVYESAIRATYGQLVVPPRTGRPERPGGAPVGARVCERTNNRVTSLTTRVVLGTATAVAAALMASAVSRVVSTCFVERQNGTDRNRCRRKMRKSYGFSKDGDTHRATTALSYFSDNFGCPVCTLRAKGEDGMYRVRTSAMAAGLTDHVQSLAE